MKLFCFSIAGGSTEIFDPLASIIGPSIQVVSLEYAGHGKRIHQPLYNSIDELADDMYSLLIRNYNGCEEYALLGYSMGSITLIEVLRRIMEREEICLPRHLFIAAHAPRLIEETKISMDACSDIMLKEYTFQFGGIPKELLNNEYFWKIYLPIYRSDYSLISSYNYDKKQFNIYIPVDIFYCESDTPRYTMHRWNCFFKSDIVYHQYDGGHFFIKANVLEISKVICDCLERV